MNDMRDKVVIYHANCPDGFCAAWLFSLCYGRGNDIIYYPAKYGDPSIPLSEIVGKDVYLLDFSYSEETLLQMVSSAYSVTVLDHHKTAAGVIKLLDEGVIEGTYKNDQSGAMLTLHYLNGKGFEIDKADQEIVEYVQDRDLWLWKLDDSRDVNAAIQSYPYDFESWDSLPSIEELKYDGVAINRYKNILIKQHTDHAVKEWHTLPNGEAHNVLTVDCTCVNLVSEIGERLSVGEKYAVIKSPTSVSLRSNLEHGLDVGVIAKLFGGGGHKNSAGYRVDGAKDK